jgi:hypothetical protein
MADLVDQTQRLARAFLALPENERDDFLRQIEVASLRWLDPAPADLTVADPLFETLYLIEKARKPLPPMRIRRYRGKKRPRARPAT